MRIIAAMSDQNAPFKASGSMPRAGLAFLLPGETLDTASVVAHLSNLLSDEGHDNWPLPCEEDNKGHLSCDDCSIHLEIVAKGDITWLTLGVRPAEQQNGQFLAESRLAQVVFTVLSTMTPECIAWLSPSALLSASEFKHTLTAPAPRRVQVDTTSRHERPSGHRDHCSSDMQKHVAPAAEQKDDPLALALRHEPTLQELADEFGEDAVPEPNVRRASVWFMTALLALVAFPAAAALAIVNLLKGEDFRLATQALALTVFIAGTNASTALAGVLQ